MIKIKSMPGTFYLIWFLICSTIVISQNCKTGEEIENQSAVTGITVSQAFELIQNNQNSENFIILDVRTPSEYQRAHLENAINIDYYSEHFQALLAELVKNRTYLVYCQSGNRSSQATNMMANMDYNHVYNMLGGISAWIAAGYSVISGSGTAL